MNKPNPQESELALEKAKDMREMEKRSCFYRQIFIELSLSVHISGAGSSRCEHYINSGSGLIAV